MDKNKDIKTNDYLSNVIHDQKVTLSKKDNKVKPIFYRGMNEDLTKLDITD